MIMLHRISITPRFLREARHLVLLGCIFVLTFITAAPCTVYAKSAVDTWDGTTDTSWYDASNPQNAYTISTAEELAGIGDLLIDGVSFSGITINLDSDLDLSGHEWHALGDEWRLSSSIAAFFEGTFDGGGHTISGMTMSASSFPEDDTTPGASYAGLFAQIRNATIRNVQMTEISITAESGLSALNFGSIVAESRQSTIENCSASGSIKATNNCNLGGIVGSMYWGSNIRGCYSDMDLSVVDGIGFFPDAVGGIAGACQLNNSSYRSNVSDCIFVGSINVPGPTAIIGGIIGNAETNRTAADNVNPYVNNCIVATSELSAPRASERGAAAKVMVKWADDPSYPQVNNCYWSDALGYDIVQIISLNEGEVSPVNNESYGSAVTDFADPALVSKLNENDTANPNGSTWVEGVVGHPVLWWQTNLAAADYTAVDDALATIPANLSGYTAESATVVETARDAVDRTLTADRQAEVNAMADAIEAAVAALERLADYSAVDAAVAQAEALDRSLYTEDTLAALDAAVATVVHGYGETRQDEVNAMAAAIEAALATLEQKPASAPKPAPEAKPATGTIPATGDASLLAAIGCAGAGISTAALGMLVRKRR